MPEPILVIDHGYAVAKVCLFEDTAIFSFKVPLGFKASEHLSVLESLLYVITEAEKKRKIKILDKEKLPLIPMYVSGEIASVELKGLLRDLPLGTVEALRESGFSLVDVGSTFTFVKIQKDNLLSQDLRSGLVSRERPSATFVSAWIPFKISLGEVENYIRNKELYPPLIPTTTKELYLEQALAREKIRKITEPFEEDEGLFEKNYDSVSVVLSGGVLSGAPKYQQAFHIFMDGINLPGVYKLFLDKEQIVVCLGTLKRFDKKAAKNFVNTFRFVPLGTAICLEPLGPPQENVKVSIDLGLKNPQEMLVESGEILLFPLDVGEKAEVRLETSKKESFSCEVEGGEVGVVIDARGKPLERPPFGSLGWEFLERWDKQMNAHGQVAEI